MSISKEKIQRNAERKRVKVTNQRLLVLEVLADHRDKHMTAEDIYELVKRTVRRSDWLQFTEQCSCY